MRKYILVVVVAILGAFSSVAYAQSDVVLLSPFPTTGPSSNFDTYVPLAFNIAIGIAGVLAVIMIVIAGLQYMSTDAIGGKEDAKSKITAALGGLLLALAAYILLQQINPDLVKFKLPNVEVGVTQSSAPTTTPKPKTCTVTKTAQQACADLGGAVVLNSCSTQRPAPNMPGPVCCSVRGVGRFTYINQVCQ